MSAGLDIRVWPVAPRSYSSICYPHLHKTTVATCAGNDVGRAACGGSFAFMADSSFTARLLSLFTFVSDLGRSAVLTIFNTTVFKSFFGSILLGLKVSTLSSFSLFETCTYRQFSFLSKQLSHFYITTNCCPKP